MCCFDHEFTLPSSNISVYRILVVFIIIRCYQLSRSCHRAQYSNITLSPSLGLLFADTAAGAAAACAVLHCAGARSRFAWWRLPLRSRQFRLVPLLLLAHLRLVLVLNELDQLAHQQHYKGDTDKESSIISSVILNCPVSKSTTRNMSWDKLNW